MKVSSDLLQKKLQCRNYLTSFVILQILYKMLVYVDVVRQNTKNHDDNVSFLFYHPINCRRADLSTLSVVECHASSFSFNK